MEKTSIRSYLAVLHLAGACFENKERVWKSAKNEQKQYIINYV